MIIKTFVIKVEDAPVDEKFWIIEVEEDKLIIRTVSDAGIKADLITVERRGTVITSVSKGEKPNE